MKNIRTFIVCSSLLLVAWLAASYSTELDHASIFTESITSSESTPEKPVAQTSKARQEMMAATASLETN